MQASTSSQLTRISHVAIEVADVSRMAEFYRDLWGLEVTDEDKANLFLRSDTPDHHTVALYAGAARKLHHVAFETATRDELERIAEAAVRHSGVLVYGPGPSPDEPGVDRLVRFQDPDGNVLEVFTGMQQVRDPYGPRHVKPQGLNHVVIRVSDMQRSEAFYQHVLGMRTSDWIKDFMTFLRCNPNHHSIALKQTGAGLDHAAFNTASFEDISRGVYVLGEHRVKRIWGPGRHGPGNNLFAYFADPEGNVVEYTADVVQVDEASWEPKVWEKNTGNLWPGQEAPLPY